jgi:hypothetical protein
MISTDGIGRIALECFERPVEFAGKTLEIDASRAGDVRGVEARDGTGYRDCQARPVFIPAVQHKPRGESFIPVA